jgi:site-specific DNA-cytosine methylase
VALYFPKTCDEETVNVLDLFSGIGAFSLGLERAGMQTVAFCEIDPFCRKILKKHWPEVPCYEDVTALTADRLRADGIAVDVVCGGWPCQDISLAGKGAGIDGERSGLWSEYARIVGEVRPRYAIMENVSALLGRGMERVLGDLAAIFYDAEGHCIPAASIGAPHLRDRIWIVAYPGGDAVRDEQQRLPGRRPRGVRDEGKTVPGDDGAQRALADPDRGGQLRPRRRVSKNGDASRRDDARDRRSDMADSDGGGRREQGYVGEAPRDAEAGQLGDGREMADSDAGGRERSAERAGAAAQSQSGRCGEVCEPGRPRLQIGPGTLRQWAHAATSGASRRTAESGMGRNFDGPSEGMDAPGGIWGPGWEDGTSRTVEEAASKKDRRKRLIAIGNALVPAIPQIIGGAIMKFEGLK